MHSFYHVDPFAQDMSKGDTSMKVYVASSWRCPKQPAVVAALRDAGHDVYDFRHPNPGDNGFSWSDIDGHWQQWSAKEFRRGLAHDLAAKGFKLDMQALKKCDACVLVLPCGRSAHLEMGYAVGANKLTCVLLEDGCEPELMYRMCTHICLTIDEIISCLRAYHG